MGKQAHAHAGHESHAHLHLNPPPAPPPSLGAVYTCPMHPEIRQDHPGNCPKCGMPLEPVLPELEETENGGARRRVPKRGWLTMASARPFDYEAP